MNLLTFIAYYLLLDLFVSLLTIGLLYIFRKRIFSVLRYRIQEILGWYETESRLLNLESSVENIGNDIYEIKEKVNPEIVKPTFAKALDTVFGFIKK